MLDRLPPGLVDNLTTWLLAALVFALVWVVRAIVVQVARSLLRRLSARHDKPIDVVVRSLVTAPLRLLTLAIAIDLSARVLELDPELAAFVFRLTRTLTISAVLLGVYNVVGALMASSSRLRAITSMSIQDALLPFLRTGLYLVILAIGTVIIIQIWGYDVTGLVAGLGLGGLAFSLAAQDTLSNLFGFSMIVSDRPFVVGEFIKTPDVEGVIERVGVRSTRVRQMNQAIVSVPNSKLASSAILNWSRLDRRWIDFTLRIDYGATVDQLQTLLEWLRAMLISRERVDAESVVVHFVGFGDNALEILIRAYVLLPDWREFTAEREQINFEIMRLVKDAGVSLAYPTWSINVEKMPGDATRPLQRQPPDAPAGSAAARGGNG